MGRIFSLWKVSERGIRVENRVEGGGAGGNYLPLTIHLEKGDNGNLLKK